MSEEKGVRVNRSDMRVGMDGRGTYRVNTTGSESVSDEAHISPA